MQAITTSKEFRQVRWSRGPWGSRAPPSLIGLQVEDCVSSDCFLVSAASGVERPGHAWRLAAGRAGLPRMSAQKTLPPGPVPSRLSVRLSAGAGLLPGPWATRGSQQHPTARRTCPQPLIRAGDPGTPPCRLRGGHRACGPLPAPPRHPSIKAALTTWESASADINSRGSVHPCTQDGIDRREMTRWVLVDEEIH